MYIDSNVFIFAALDTGEKGNSARDLLKLVEEGKIEAMVSPLVFDEVIWVVQRMTNRDVAYRVGEGMLSLPLVWADVGFTAVQAAMEYYKEGLKPRDAVHAGIMKDYEIEVIVSEDKDFDKVSTIQRKTIIDVTRE